jgi:hypothetical protein
LVTVLYRIGDRLSPFIAILGGEVAILDELGNEIARHGASVFLGELNLLSGQTVFVTAVVTRLLSYIAVDRDALRPLRLDQNDVPPPSAKNRSRGSSSTARLAALSA